MPTIGGVAVSVDVDCPLKAGEICVPSANVLGLQMQTEDSVYKPSSSDASGCLR